MVELHDCFTANELITYEGLGLTQCAELTWQLRGQAGVRQVEGARVTLQHNICLGGCVVVTMYGKD